MKVNYHKSEDGTFEAISIGNVHLAKDFMGIQICNNGQFYNGKRSKGFGYETMYDGLLDVLEDFNKISWKFKMGNLRYKLSWFHLRCSLNHLKDTLLFKYVYTFYGYSDPFVSRMEGKSAILGQEALIKLYRFLFKKKFNFHVIYRTAYHR